LECKDRLQGLYSQRDRAQSELEIEEDAHKLLIAISDYILANDPTKHIQTVVTDILRKLINPNIVSFNIETMEKRNQLETYFTITRRFGDYTETSPVIGSTSGGGTDVAFFLIRLILLVNDPRKPRRLMFADEPVKNLSPDRRQLFIELLNKIAKDFEIQIPMVTHEREYLENADEIKQFSLRGHHTHVKA